MAQLFREASLDKLVSPIQLDHLMAITKPSRWLFLVGLTLFLLAAFFWSFYSHLTIAVSGEGIFLPETKTDYVRTSQAGTLVALRVVPGQTVVRNQVIAVLDSGVQPPNGAPGPGNPLGNANQTRDLSKNGERASSSLTHATTHEILSPYEGSVLAMQSYPGQSVGPGDAVISVLREGPSEEPVLLAFLYVTLQPEVRIERGMTVRLKPGHPKDEGEGELSGTVEAYSPNPISRQEAMLRLKDPQRVVQIFSQGPIIEVVVHLNGDVVGGAGQELPLEPPIQAGTFFSGRIEIDHYRPLDLVFPFFGRNKK